MNFCLHFGQYNHTIKFLQCAKPIGIYWSFVDRCRCQWLTKFSLNTNRYPVGKRFVSTIKPVYNWIWSILVRNRVEIILLLYFIL